MNKTIITGIAALFCSAAFAQQAGIQEPAPEPAASTQSGADYGGKDFLNSLDSQAESTNNVRSSVSDFISSKGWNLGKNDHNNYYVASGFASINMSPTDKNYEIARSLAYQNAMANAKKSIVNAYGQEISTRLQSIYEEPGSAQSKIQKAESEAGIDSDIMNKLMKLADAKVDEELAKINKDKNSPEAQEVIREVLSSSSITSAIERTSSYQVSGLVAKKIFEQDGQIGVVAYYSDKTLDLVAALNGYGTRPKDAPRTGASVEEWIKAKKIGELYLSQGIHLTTDKEGNLVIVSYGLSRALSKSMNSINAAMNKAELDAVGNIRRFAGELVTTSDMKSEAIQSIEYADSNNQASSEVDQIMQSKIEQVAKSLKITGITTVRTWDRVDPRTDSTLCGVVCIWSTKTAKIKPPIVGPNGPDGGSDGGGTTASPESEDY